MFVGLVGRLRLSPAEADAAARDGAYAAGGVYPGDGTYAPLCTAGGGEDTTGGSEGSSPRTGGAVVAIGPAIGVSGWGGDSAVPA